MRIHDPLLGFAADHRPAEDVCGGRDVENGFRQPGLGNAAGAIGEPAPELATTDAWQLIVGIVHLIGGTLNVISTREPLKRLSHAGFGRLGATVPL
jgi:hypothetical protein